jgi:phenylacetate-CoA ligase
MAKTKSNGPRGARGSAMLEPEVETAPRERLSELQLKRLRATVSLAYQNVEPVRRRFSEAGISPRDLKSLHDLSQLPFTSKRDLLENYPFGHFAVAQRELRRIHASSGTTSARPTVVGYTQRDLDTWSGLMARSLACAGAVAGDVLHNAFGYGLFTGGLGFHYGAERLGCTVVPISGGSTERQVTMMRDLRATVMASTPSYAMRIAEVAEQTGAKICGGPLRLGVFGAEPWSETMRVELEKRLGINAIDLYGLSEVMGPGVAVECGAKRGMHVWEDHFIAEIIDPETGRPLPYGEIGELVITTLTKQALPIIRYRTRDITRATDERCTCGRTHARISKLTGRTDDMLIIRGVNVFPSQVEEVLLGFTDLSAHYQLTVSRSGPMDSLKVQIEANPKLGAAEYSVLAVRVEHQLKSSCGVSCAVTIESPGTLPRYEGKALRVRDLRKQSGSR